MSETKLLKKAAISVSTHAIRHSPLPPERGRGKFRNACLAASRLIDSHVASEMGCIVSREQMDWHVSDTRYVCVPGQFGSAKVKHLTMLDASPMLENVLLDAVWLYDAPLDPEALSASLAQLLSMYPILAGRHDGSNGVVLNNHGVAFSVQTLSGSAFNYAAPNPGPKHGLLADLRDKNKMKQGLEPLMTVRVTNFADGTSSIGICISHALVDGFSFNKLVQIWLQGHKKGFPSEPTYSFDRNKLFDLLPEVDAETAIREKGANRIGAVLPAAVKFITNVMANRVRARIHLSYAEMLEFRASFADKVFESTPSATFGVLLMARLTKLLSGHLQPKLTSNDLNLVMFANLRGRGGLPTNYLGNLTVSFCTGSNLACSGATSRRVGSSPQQSLRSLNDASLLCILRAGLCHQSRATPTASASCTYGRARAGEGRRCGSSAYRWKGLGDARKGPSLFGGVARTECVSASAAWPAPPQADGSPDIQQPNGIPHRPDALRRRGGDRIPAMEC
eukprot:3903316-Prymnesium_polylepis.1